MNEEIKKTFLRWLSEQAYRTDNTGKFARSIINADNIPKTSSLLDWYKFIKASKLTSIDVFISVWGEYTDKVRMGGDR